MTTVAMVMVGALYLGVCVLCFFAGRALRRALDSGEPVRRVVVERMDGTVCVYGPPAEDAQEAA